MKISTTYPIIILFTISLICIQGSFAQEAGKVRIHGIYMMPYGHDAQDVSRAGFGIGGNVAYPLPSTRGALAGIAGLEYVNLLSETIEFTDYVGGVPFPVSQQTSQGMARLYLGTEFGPHNARALFQPHAGADLALVVYWISTDIVIENENDPNNNVSKNKSGNAKAVFGFDLTMGLDMKFWDQVSIDGGIKYLKSFSLPQQLGEGAVTMYPQYFQVYLGAGFSFDAFSSHSE